VPYKSKKNRRSINPNRASVPAPAGTGETISAPASVNQAVKTTLVRPGFSKAAAVPIETHFLSELKWIGLVTVVIIILMIVAYYIFR
jgi:hypothetical protein